jgi:hypothetical protein
MRIRTMGLPARHGRHANLLGQGKSMKSDVQGWSFGLSAVRRCLLGVMSGGAISAASAADLSYLQALLAATPAGGWVYASSNSFSSAWVSGADALPNASFTNPGSIIRAWSSFAWDPNNDQLMLWGGGHGNYIGNEMYLWKGETGEWTRGSVPSRITQVGQTSTWLVVDNAAPQSAHTYDNNIFLPLNNMFLTFGGATYNSGGNFQTADGQGNLVRAGAWLYDPMLADAGKVGGTTGSGYSPTTPGGQMWLNRAGQASGSQPFTFVSSATAYRQENGRDVVYVAADSRDSSGWKDLYRYTLGNVRAGEQDTWEKLGVAWNAPSQSGAATIDSAHGLFVNTSPWPNRESDFSVWNLSNSNAVNPTANKDTAVQLVFADGSQFQMTTSFGVDFDGTTGQLILWDGTLDGTVYTTKAEFDSNGNVASTWLVNQVQSTTSAQPSGNFTTGVLGKWEYVSELGAFVALDEYDPVAQDAQVWLYKPLGAVPEPDVYALFLAGLGVLALRARRRCCS